MGLLFDKQLTDDIPNNSFEHFLYNAQLTFIIGAGVFCIFCILILCYEIKNRRTISTKIKKTRKWILLWSMLTILSSLFAEMLCILYKIPSTFINICPYTTHLAFFVWFAKNLFFGLFQLCRLQGILTNDTKLKRFTNVVIPAIVFKIFYVFAVLILILWICFLLESKVIHYNKYGCYFAHTFISWILNFIFMIAYTLWDGATLYLNVSKLMQLRHIIEEHEHDTSDSFADDILSALSKILLLTLINEVTFLLSCIFIFIVAFTFNEYVVIIFELILSAFGGGYTINVAAII
eukprot:84401_1